MAKEPDIFALLDAVYGDSSSARESTLDSAVQTVERTQRSYTAMRQFTETGKIIVSREQTTTGEREVDADARAIAEAAARAEASGEAAAATAQSTPAPRQVDRNATTNTFVRPIDPEATEIVRRAPRVSAEAAKASASAAVVSGSGADFNARGNTKTQIVVRSKKWFSK